MEAKVDNTFEVKTYAEQREAKNVLNLKKNKHTFYFNNYCQIFSLCLNFSLCHRKINVFPVSQNFSLCQSKIPCVFPVWKK